VGKKSERKKVYGCKFSRYQWMGSGKYSPVYEGAGKGVSACKDGTVLSLDRNLLRTFCHAALAA